MSDNKRRTAIITGSNRGIGKALVEAFAESGYDVWACSRKRSDEFEEFLGGLSEANDAAIKPVYFDLSDEGQIKSGIGQIMGEKRAVDVLINNAGVPYGGLMTMTPIEKVKEVYEVNVFAQVSIMQLVAKKMIRQKSGCIINMCSVGGIETTPGYLAYGSSKAALIWITRSVARELAPYNIRVNGIAPGLVDTDMGNFKPGGELTKTIERTGMKRMGRPSEIARAALFMASDDASFMNGHIMVVDGGRVCV